MKMGGSDIENIFLPPFELTVVGMSLNNQRAATHVDEYTYTCT